MFFGRKGGGGPHYLLQINSWPVIACSLLRKKSPWSLMKGVSGKRKQKKMPTTTRTQAKKKIADKIAQRSSLQFKLGRTRRALARQKAQKASLRHGHTSMWVELWKLNRKKVSFLKRCKWYRQSPSEWEEEQADYVKHEGKVPWPHKEHFFADSEDDLGFWTTACYHPSEDENYHVQLPEKERRHLSFKSYLLDEPMPVFDH